jgi:hypothetical protein
MSSVKSNCNPTVIHMSRYQLREESFIPKKFLEPGLSGMRYSNLFSSRYITLFEIWMARGRRLLLPEERLTSKEHHLTSSLSSGHALSVKNVY